MHFVLVGFPLRPLAELLQQIVTNPEDSLQLIALDTFDAGGNPTCPQALDLSEYLLEVGGESFVCVERSFYYNDVIGAAVVPPGNSISHRSLEISPRS